MLNHTLINYEYLKAIQIIIGVIVIFAGAWLQAIHQAVIRLILPQMIWVLFHPTAALSSFPYTTAESMNALKFFYYKLGDKIWKEYGFVDAFSLKNPWFADSFLALDQGPVIVMIENFRTGLLWNLFTSCPEVKDGMRKLGFFAPYL